MKMRPWRELPKWKQDRIITILAVVFGLCIVFAIAGCATTGPGPAILPAAAEHTMYMHRFRAEGDSILRVLNESRGNQSRDHGDLIREAAKNGEFPRAKGCLAHRVEIRGYDSLEPITVLVNGRNSLRVAPRFGVLTIPLQVCDGEGTITLDPMAVRELMTLWIFGPPGIYPKSGLLRTCTREEILQKRPWCGPLPGDPEVRHGEFYFLGRTYLRSHYYMVE